MDLILLLLVAVPFVGGVTAAIEAGNSYVATRIAVDLPWQPLLFVPDAAAFAAIRVLEKMIDRKCGGSTGTNLWAVARIISQMQSSGESGSIVTLICDSGDRYLDTYYNDDWLASKQIDIVPYQAQFEDFVGTGMLAE